MFAHVKISEKYLNKYQFNIFLIKIIRKAEIIAKGAQNNKANSSLCNEINYSFFNLFIFLSLLIHQFFQSDGRISQKKISQRARKITFPASTKKAFSSSMWMQRTEYVGQIDKSQKKKSIPQRNVERIYSLPNVKKTKQTEQIINLVFLKKKITFFFLD